MRILVTGSRDWTLRTVVRAALLGHAWIGRAVRPVLIHGGARGADTIAAEEFVELFGHRGSVEVFPADWERYGKAAGYRRNAEMVKAGADVCLAFPLGESRGTRMCMKLAEEAGIPVLNYGDE